MSAHAAKRVGGWRAVLAILPLRWTVGGRRATDRQIPRHEGATPEYGDELAAMNRARTASKSRTFRRPPQPKPEPRTEYVATDATEATEAELRDRQMGRRDPEGPITGEFHQCHGCHHLGCLGDCPQLTVARGRADFATQWVLGANRARLEQQTVHGR